VATLATSTPVSSHVAVDFELRGCPIDKRQLLGVLSALLARRQPRIPGHSVCYECKLRGTACVMVAHGTPCLGPVTQAGCGAICPSFDRGCYGCFGPMATPNTAALVPALMRLRMAPDDVHRMFATFNAAAPGVTVAAYLVPQVMAYAAVAGLHPVVGLWAAPPALVAYALLGSSRSLSIGPEATTALMTAIAIGPLAAGNAVRYASLATTLALLVGLMGRWVSHPQRGPEPPGPP
jgi:hypothetical protein